MRSNACPPLIRSGCGLETDVIVNRSGALWANAWATDAFDVLGIRSPAASMATPTIGRRFRNLMSHPRV